MTAPAPRDDDFAADIGAAPATPGYVLAVLRDQHRHVCSHDPAANPNVDLTFDSTVAEWREAVDLLEWRPLAAALDEMWGLNRSEKHWRAVLEPAGERTLRDVCEFIAAGAVRPAVVPVTIAGSACPKAGAFLAVRGLLVECGLPPAEARRIGPSTPLAGYTRRFGGELLWRLGRLTPGVLPRVAVDDPVHDAAVTVCVVGWLCLMAGSAWVVRLWPLALFGGGLFAVGQLVAWSGSVWPPGAVTFGELRTFRDLAEALAAAEPA